MTVEELLAREGIRHTMARYSVAGDEFDTATYISCFTDDAVLEFAHFPGIGDLRLEGRQAILDFVSGWFDAVKSGEAPVPGGFMRHHLTTCRIDFTGADRATAKTYCMEFNRNGAEHCGLYSDEFRCLDGQWLIHRRKWLPDN